LILVICVRENNSVVRTWLRRKTVNKLIYISKNISQRFCSGLIAINRVSNICFQILKQLTPRIYKKIISYKYFKISLQIYIIVARNWNNLHIFTFLLWKQTLLFSVIGIFLLYITATALVMPPFHQGLFLSNRPDMYQIIPDDLFFWSARLSFW